MAIPLSNQSLDATLTEGNACEFPTNSSVWRCHFRCLYLHPVVNSWIAEDSFTFFLFMQEYGGTWKSTLLLVFTYRPCHQSLLFLNSGTYWIWLPWLLEQFHYIQEYRGTWYNTLLLPVIAYRPCKQSLLFLNSCTLCNWFRLTGYYFHPVVTDVLRVPQHFPGILRSVEEPDAKPFSCLPKSTFSAFSELRHPLDVKLCWLGLLPCQNLNIVLSSGCSGFGRGGDFSLE